MVRSENLLPRLTACPVRKISTLVIRGKKKSQPEKTQALGEIYPCLLQKITSYSGTILVQA